LLFIARIALTCSSKPLYRKAGEARTCRKLLILLRPARVADVQFGAFRINQASPYKVIEGLREKFGIQSFFKNSVLYVGTVPPPQTAKYDFQQNIVSHNLTWKTKDEFNFGVKAVSVLPNNEIHEYTAGSNSGSVKTVTYYNLSKAELKRRADVPVTTTELRWLRWRDNNLRITIHTARRHSRTAR
jgi:hypothetical protein